MAKKKKQRDPCENVEGERFNANIDEVFNYNWWEIFCFPYILCSRFWDCCMSICAGANQCLIYWMVIQWIVCKITKFTTPDAIIFPYYFYMFCQTFLLTLIFFYLWSLFGQSIIIPYIMSYYKALTEYGRPDEDYKKKNKSSSLLFRRYCFRKGDIFDTAIDQEDSSYGTTDSSNYVVDIVALALVYLANEVIF